MKENGSANNDTLYRHYLQDDSHIWLIQLSGHGLVSL